MRRKIYIVNGNSRAAIYGIGTYIEQLTKCLKKTNIEFEMVYLHSDEKEVIFTEKDGYKQISIPKVFSNNPKITDYYYRNVAYLLRESIPYESNVQYVFHLNFITEYLLAENLKKMFNCKIIVVAHYTAWSFALIGDYEKLRTIMGKPETELDVMGKRISESVKNEINMISMCDKLVCVAKHSSDYFIDICKVKESNCVVINNALKDKYKESSIVQKKNIRKKYYIPDNYQMVVFAGRLDEVKGVSFLIKAFRKVLDANPNTFLYIAGEGQLSQYLSEAEESLGRIIFTGRLNKKKLYELYSIADIGVVCSLHEEFGFVAIEMMMHKLPVIVTDTGGLAEIVEDNISGLKIPVRTIKGKRCVDSAKMAQKIEFLLNNPDVASEIAKNGRERFMEKYEISLFKKKMVELYLNI